MQEMLLVDIKEQMTCQGISVDNHCTHRDELANEKYLGV